MRLPSSPPPPTRAMMRMGKWLFSLAYLWRWRRTAATRRRESALVQIQICRRALMQLPPRRHPKLDFSGVERLALALSMKSAPARPVCAHTRMYIRPLRTGMLLSLIVLACCECVRALCSMNCSSGQRYFYTLHHQIWTRTAKRMRPPATHTSLASNQIGPWKINWLIYFVSFHIAREWKIWSSLAKPKILIFEHN